MKMKIYHYTENANFKLYGIEIKNKFIWCKPKGGLWTSPSNSLYGWNERCKEEGFRDNNKLTIVEMIIDVDDLGNNKNLIVIDKEDDLDKLIWSPVPDIRELVEKTGFKVSFGMEMVDFVKMKENGIDAIWLTMEGQWKTRLTYPRNLYGWDCECVLILNERCIKTVVIKEK